MTKRASGTAVWRAAAGEPEATFGLLDLSFAATDMAGRRVAIGADGAGPPDNGGGAERTWANRAPH